MFLFNAKTALWQSFRTHFAQANFAHVYFFTGEVPESFEDIPFNYDDPVEVFNQCSYAKRVEVHNGIDGAPQKAYSRFSSYKNYGAVRTHSLMERWDRWRLIPRSIIAERYYNTDFTAKDPSWDEDETEFRRLHFANRYFNQIRSDARDLRQYTANDTGAVPYANSSAHLNPQVYMYDQPVTVTSFEFFSWSNANNTARYVAVEYWDADLNEGQGDWVQSDAAIYMYDTFYARRIVELAGPITSTQFRFTFSSVGSGAWAMNYMWLLGEEPTWGKDPIDITWALVGTAGPDIYSNYFAKNQFNSYNTPLPEYPNMIVDVGSVGAGTTIELSQAEGLTGNDEPLIQKFDIEFLDQLL